MFCGVLLVSAFYSLANCAPQYSYGASQQQVQHTNMVMMPAASAPAMQQTQMAGMCPEGPSLGIPCDAKRPNCPPLSYCYATDSVDLGPYLCCPVATRRPMQWRPRTPSYNYGPPSTGSWPQQVMANSWPQQPAWPQAVAQPQQQQHVVVSSHSIIGNGKNRRAADETMSEKAIYKIE